MTHRLLILLVLLAPGACTDNSSTITAHVPSFRLQCAASSTATAAQIHCMRTDTRTGDIVRVEMFQLPISEGPTGAPPGPPGRFETQCAAASTHTKSDFYCLRLNTETGEMMLVNLQKIPPFPPLRN